MKFHKPVLGLVALCLLCAGKPALHANSKKDIGIVNFATCVTESKLGKQEQEAMENIKNQMAHLIKDIEEQLQDLTGKLSDSDFLDGLSPEGEQELKMKYGQLREEHERYQQQFYQVMQQANMKLVQTVSSYVNAATGKIAKAKKLSLVVNKDACFSFDETFDITQVVIEEMDKSFDELQAQAVSKADKQETSEEQTAVN
ncbi:MAG: hypothetical protein S4CHLAM37_13220 [Chlamydiia bacterium]|nr:hypothetical protein [Chlamydiia bacterium]